MGSDQDLPVSTLLEDLGDQDVHAGERKVILRLLDEDDVGLVDPAVEGQQDLERLLLTVAHEAEGQIVEMRDERTLPGGTLRDVDGQRKSAVTHGARVRPEVSMEP